MYVCLYRLQVFMGISVLGFIFFVCPQRNMQGGDLFRRCMKRTRGGGPLEMRLTVYKSWWAAPEKRFPAHAVSYMSYIAECW
jgi:hypothetical protein